MSEVETQLFWAVATLEIVLAACVALLQHRQAKAKSPSVEQERAASGQAKDNLLACAVIWMTIILCTGDPSKSALPLAGAVVLAWLSRRAWQRLKALATPP